MAGSDDSKMFSWQALVAIGGLIATIAGLVVQYQGKQAELEQAQTKIEAANREAEDRKQAKVRKRTELESRLQEIDSQIEAQELEIRRGSAGMVFAPTEQKPLAAEIISTAAAKKSELLAARAKLQEKIDGLPVD